MGQVDSFSCLGLYLVLRGNKKACLRLDGRVIPRIGFLNSKLMYRCYYIPKAHPQSSLGEDRTALRQNVNLLSSFPSVVSMVFVLTLYRRTYAVRRLKSAVLACQTLETNAPYKILCRE